MVVGKFAYAATVILFLCYFGQSYSVNGRGIVQVNVGFGPPYQDTVGFCIHRNRPTKR